jgi:N-acylneuraminate cytidylyltransferase/CMP-N,N'-diacetyllegionaminic acid synthase
MKTLVTICARGGSKGVPNKNIRLLAGKPLIAHTIGQAQGWGKADRVIVSTDSPEIAAVARDFSAEVPFMRPSELATDTADKLAVIRHAVSECERIFQTRYDLIVDLDATSPIRKTEDLDRCYEIFTGKKPDLLFSVVRAHKNPYFNMVELNREGFAELSKRLPQAVHRRQDAPVVYAMNASIYFFRRDFLLDPANSSLFAGRALIYEMDDLSAVDIDREIDFKFVEFLFREGLIS